MKKIIFIIGLVFLFSGLKSQTTICPTVSDIHFFIYKNDTVIFEPTKVSPGTSVITNYSQVGSEIFISDCDSLCCDRIKILGLKCSQYSIIEP
jgi:hypothetical protein